jgi:hypothetical protein
LAKQAIIVHEGDPGEKELRLGRVLDFFGVVWQSVGVSKLAGLHGRSCEYAVFGSVQTIATILKQQQGADSPHWEPAAFYAYADDERDLCSRALRTLLEDGNLSLQDAPVGNLPLCVSGEIVDITGPMAGLKISLPLKSEDALLIGAPHEEAKFATVISVRDSPVFLRFQQNGIPVYFCASSQMVDIDQPMSRGFYDVKDHFCSVVPLVMFIRFFLPGSAWRPQEIGACLIIDDPLLKREYGFCDFVKLRSLMQVHGFTTNIAFIPWNWRRTSPAAGDFFRNAPELFSVSIHGCDHTGGEFGATSLEVLRNAAQLAQSRMQNHAARTGIQHDSIMVFPQGVFSSECPEVLKRSGFLAAVNTETIPVDSQNARTRIRDVWDVAIMSYGEFPIFTRRYAFHGLENFAFDILLGKPCLIVAHHDFFKDGGVGLIELIEKIGSLSCCLRWRSLGEVIRRACRRRASGEGAEEIEMYGNEFLVSNASDQAVELRIRKRASHNEPVSEILCNERPISWATGVDHLFFGERIGSGEGRHFRVVYRDQVHAPVLRRSLHYELSVAARRILSEFRDDYLARRPFLSGPADVLKRVLQKAI